MLNREVYVQDPKEFHLLNNGVAKVRDADSAEELKTLRFELKTFICEGQYEQGLIRLLRSYIDNLNQPEQPAAWISGFFGSGKSHLVKMLRYLWIDYKFPDGATARGLANLSPKVEELLQELTTQGRRLGGLHAASGTLGASAKGSVRLALLNIIFKSAGLPTQYPLARFVMWLKNEGLYEELRRRVENDDRDWERELRNLTKSRVIPKHLIDLDSSLGNDVAEVRQLLKSEHPRVDDVSLDDMVWAIREALAPDGEFPCTLIVLDEVQQFIDDDSEITHQIQLMTEACVSAFGSKILFVATGQSALTGTPELSKLTGRYRVRVQLSDADVETVTRKTVLKKKESARPEIEKVLTRNSGEISRHLTGTDFALKPEDERHIVDDYPLLPTRRRFWERTLRVVDEAGTESQVRSQLKIVDEAVKETAGAPLGTVIGADFLYFDKRSELLTSGILTNDVDTRIEKLRHEAEDELDARLCALAFLIGKLPREKGADTGLRATPETLADLLVEDLESGSSTLRNRVEERLEKLAEQGILMCVEDEYRMQTRESQEWMHEYQSHFREIKNRRERIASLREEALRKAATATLDNVRKIKHGTCNERRSTEVYYSRERPNPSEDAIPIWVRHEWSDTEKSVEADARQEDTDSPMIFVFLPKRSADELDEAIATEKAAKTTLEVKGRTSTQEGMEARQAMETRRESATQRKEAALADILDGARVFLAGGQEYVADTVIEAVENAARSALERMYPEFDVADHNRWGRVLKRARNGDPNALEEVDHRGNPEDHPVCAAVLKAVSSTTTGQAVRKDLTTAPYGWPQDAVDASLVLLTQTNHVRARQNGQPVDAADLTQRNIGTTRFAAESVKISRKQILELRNLLGSLVEVEPEKEADAVPRFLHTVKTLADKLSGPPPLPARPDISYVEEVERYSGNEQFAKLHEYKERFLRDTGEWQSRLSRKERRETQWSQLQTALRHAADLEGVEAIQTQADAVKENRSLLADSDPVQPLLDQATDLLRDAVKTRHDAYTTAYEKQLEALEASEAWQALDAEMRSSILAKYDLDRVPAIEVGTTEQLLDTLDATPLAGWEARLDALPQRFNKALSEAIRELEPETERIQLESRVLKTKGDVEAWIESTREMLLQKVENNPVQI